MTRPDRRIAIPAALFAVAAMAAATVSSPALAAGTPPFCVMRGGGNGPGSSPQICAYFDYQTCLQAASDSHGNCVQNIDYHGEVSTAPAPARVRHRR
jgi:hypothetical protein